jgi:hypothetical protein
VAERRPLVVITGRLQELPVGDTLPGASSADLSNLIDGVTSELTANSSRVYSSYLTITDDGELKVPATSSVTIVG